MDKANRTSFLSGFAIALAAFCYSTLSGAVTGALLFSFGLITVILYRWKLYTGTAGFVITKKEFLNLGPILFFNGFGCFIAALFLCTFGNETTNDFINNAIELRKFRDYNDTFIILAKGLCCGFIMTTAVKFAREGASNGFQFFLPLLLGVPIFLLSGFFHSIVDAFYVSYGLISGLPALKTTEACMASIIGWILVAVGNLIGCNLTRLITFNKNA